MNNFCEKKHRLPLESYRGIVTVSYTACIEHRKSPFIEQAIVDQFRSFLRDALTKNQCSGLIYCFMPDHLHVVVHGQSKSADTWRTMVNFKQQSGFWFGQNRREFVWQKDFHDHIIRANEDLAAHIRYIADNPVRKGLVVVCDEYPFTGAIGINLNEILVDTTIL